VLLPDASVTNLNFGPNSVQINAAPGMDANAVYNLFVEGVRMNVGAHGSVGGTERGRD